MNAITDKNNLFSNVFVYMADALRYDYAVSHLETIQDGNNIVKTISGGLFTPPCVSTIISGLAPPRHGVYSFSNPLKKENTTIFDLVNGSRRTYGLNKTFMQEISSIEDTEDPKEWEQYLNTLEEPFACVKRDLYTHAPYNQEWEGRGEFDSLDGYLKSRLPDTEAIIKDYKDSISKVEQRFLSDIEILRKNGLLEDTLIIFTSDHGELLGEYGLFGHGWAEVPEIVYVPTVFYNDCVTVDGDSMAHQDLLPTINSLLKDTTSINSSWVGKDLTQGNYNNRIGFNMHTHSKKEWGVWDKDGGYTFARRSYKDLIIQALRISSSWQGKYARKHPVSWFSLYWNQNRSFDNPNFSEEKAKQISTELLTNEENQKQEKPSEEAQERLKALGYRNDQIK